MSDLIDRQAVIDLLKQMRKDGDMVPWEGKAVFARIRKLPTIQPERTEERTEAHACDLISRQAAIDIFDDYNVSVENGELEAYSRDRKRLCELPPIQPVATDTNVGATISKFIDGLEEIFADLRERHVDDSVCGLCEYDGAYMGQSGDWCNECPGFDRDDCFKLSDETRRKWTAEIIKALPTIQPERQKGEWIDYTEDGYVECPFCHSATNCDGNKDELHFCFSCGADMRGEQDG